MLKTGGNRYLWELCMWTCVFKLVLSVCDWTTGSYLGIFFKGIACKWVWKNEGPHAILCTGLQLLRGEDRSVFVCNIWQMRLHFCVYVEQGEGFWKDVGSAWSKCSWCGEEGESRSCLAFLRLALGQLAVLLSLLWSAPSVLNCKGSVLESHTQ